MRHSRSISDLRADVAENCRALLMLAEREGLSVLVTETVRDAEYQRMLAEKGYAAKGAVTALGRLALHNKRQRIGVHADEALGHGHALGDVLLGHIDHAYIALLIDMRQMLLLGHIRSP